MKYLQASSRAKILMTVASLPSIAIRRPETSLPLSCRQLLRSNRITALFLWRRRFTPMATSGDQTPMGPCPDPAGLRGRASRTCLRLSGSQRRSRIITGIATMTDGMTIGSMITDTMMTGSTMAVTMARAAISMIRAMAATAAPAGRVATAMISGVTTGIARASAARAIHNMTRAALTEAVMEGRGVEHACCALGFSA